MPLECSNYAQCFCLTKMLEKILLARLCYLYLSPVSHILIQIQSKAQNVFLLVIRKKAKFRGKTVFNRKQYLGITVVVVFVIKSVTVAFGQLAHGSGDWNEL